jgi:hypothetical protein
MGWTLIIVEKATANMVAMAIITANENYHDENWFVAHRIIPLPHLVSTPTWLPHFSHHIPL